MNPRLIALLLGFAAPTFASGQVNLVKNGGFEEVYDNGMPADWRNISHENHLERVGTTLVVVPEGSFLRVTRKTAEVANLGEQRIQLPPGTRRVRVALRIRVNDLQPGTDFWQVPGLAYSWILADNSERQIGPGNWLSARDMVNGWIPLQTVLERPADATGIKISIQGIGWIGQADFDHIVVEALK